MSRKSPRGRPPLTPMATMRGLQSNLQSGMQYTVSGEITSSQKGIPLGPATIDGKITGVYLALQDRGIPQSGEVTVYTIAVSGEVFVNKEPILDTLPQVVADAGGGPASTFAPADGVTQAVISGSGEIKAGDMLTANINISRTGSPFREAQSPTIIVDIEPHR